MDGEIFRPIFVREEFREAVSGRAWLQAMLEAEDALATAEAQVGLIPHEAAAAIVSCCEASRFDPEELGRDGRAAGNPVPPLVEALTAAVSEISEDAARYVHKGATSQDIVDSAAMLVARHALDLILDELEGISLACARLADEHRGTIMAGRTLLQQALPTTFGLKAAGWLVSVLEVRRKLSDVRDRGLAAQLGGAAGTLASLGKSGVSVLGEFARELELAEPTVPWHIDRARIAEIGGSLSLVAGVLGKISLDVILMAQTEVGEVTEPAEDGRGGSSTLPHKRNPILSVIVTADTRRVQAQAQTLYGAMAGEHERAAGAWHAEWQTLSDALVLSGGAAAAVREATEGLVVHPEKLRKNLDETRGILMAESVRTVVADRLGRLEAQELVGAAARRAADGGRTFRDELLAEPDLREQLSLEEIDAALDPAGYLGSVGEFIDRAGPLPRGGIAMTADDPTHGRGMEVRREVLGDEYVDTSMERTTSFTAHFQELTTRYAWGEIWTRPGLDRKTRSCITLTALMARGQLEELALHVRAALRNGLTEDEIKELFLQGAIYCGVPAANAAFALAQRVLAERHGSQETAEDESE